MTENMATNYDAGHRWKSHADFNLICLPYNCKLYLFKHVHMLAVGWIFFFCFSPLVSPKKSASNRSECCMLQVASVSVDLLLPHAHTASNNPKCSETTLNDCLTCFLLAKSISGASASVCCQQIIFY